MPLAGQVNTGFHDNCPPRRVAFATGLRALVDLVPCSKEYLRARMLGISKVSLSCYRGGRRVPAAGRLREIHAAVQRSVSPGAIVPDLAELESLRAEAARRERINSLRSPATRKDAGAATVIALRQVTEGREPVAPVGDRRDNGSPVTDRRDDTQALSLHRAPAPAKPDRPVSAAVASLLTAVAAHNAAGRRGDVLGLIWAAGASLSACEIGETLDGLRELGDRQATETLPHSVSRRSALEVMRLAGELIALDRTEEARHLLFAASTAA